jgi:hypothetical protein
MDHLTDAPVANILILAGILFLAVGLFGRIGGFIGSIFGNIEAGKSSRALAGVLGVALIVGGGWLHQHAGKVPAPNYAAPVPTASTWPVQPLSPVRDPSRSNPPIGVSSQVTSDLLVGTWVSQQVSSPGFLHWFQIERAGQSFTIHIWGACASADCDWGTHHLNVNGNTATYAFSNGARNNVGHIDLETPSQMQLTVDVSDPGSGGQWQNHFVLARSH